MSAHGRRFIAQRQDIDRLMSDLRVVFAALVLADSLRVTHRLRER